jgi:hypothetical protein
VELSRRIILVLISRKRISLVVVVGRAVAESAAGRGVRRSHHRRSLAFEIFRAETNATRHARLHL